MKANTILVAATLTATLAGCGGFEMPEVNDENCGKEEEFYEKVKTEKDRQLFREFSMKCFTRGGFKPSTPRSWTVHGSDTK